MVVVFWFLLGVVVGFGIIALGLICQTPSVGPHHLIFVDNKDYLKDVEIDFRKEEK